MQLGRSPTYLLPIKALETGQILGPIREKIDQEGQQKRESWTGENRPGWSVPVEIVRGTREKIFPDGRSFTTFDADALTVTVWSHSRPVVTPGEYVTFENVMVGAMNGHIYVQALGVNVVSDDYFLNFDTMEVKQ